jgi:hypothetical protein
LAVYGGQLTTNAARIASGSVPLEEDEFQLAQGLGAPAKNGGQKRKNMKKKTRAGSTPAISLKVLAKKIKAEHAAVLESARRGLRHARQAGDYLARAKKEMKHGQWLPWIEANCPFGDRTAEVYMQVAEHWAVIEAYFQANPQAPATITEALAVIAKSCIGASVADHAPVSEPIECNSKPLSPTDPGSEQEKASSDSEALLVEGGVGRQDGSEASQVAKWSELKAEADPDAEVGDDGSGAPWAVTPGSNFISDFKDSLERFRRCLRQIITSRDGWTGWDAGGKCDTADELEQFCSLIREAAGILRTDGQAELQAQADGHAPAKDDEKAA